MGDGLQLLVGGIDFGEGLRWHDGRLWYSDFFKRHVCAVDADGNREVMVEMEDQPSGLGWLPDGRLLVVSMKQRLVLRREHDGSLVTHADLSAIATSDANDMVVAADGTAYVGNFGSDLLAGEAHRTADLAVVHPDGTVAVAARALEFPNGAVITPDGRTLIVGESLGHRYRAFTIAPDGTLDEGRVWADLGDLSPDGCTLDAAGGIWFANAAGTTVARTLEGGEITDRIETPDPVFACALGGDDGRTLFFVTAASIPRAGHEPDTGRIWTTRVEVPHAGLP
jgi:sugar lactone lactonase YvrE